MIRKKLFNKIFSLLILFVFVNGLNASNGKILLEAKVDRTNIKIGDLINYSIIVTRDKDIKIEMPDLGANLGAFEIHDYEDLEPEKKNGEVVQLRHYIISTYDIGDYEIQPVTVHYSLPNDTLWKELTTESIKITVESLKPSEEGDIRDIKAPLEILKDWWLTIRFIIAGVIIVLIGILIYILYKRRKEGKSLIPRREKPKLPPHIIALDELKKLMDDNLLEKREIKQYYIRLSEIIRNYIEDRFFIVALEMTTFQLIGIMKENQVEDEIVQLVEKFLMNCDMVKFAKYIPRKKENKSTTELAYKIIEDTKIELEPEPDNGEDAENLNPENVDDVGKEEADTSEALELETAVEKGKGGADA
ncbi:hypothetical protein H8E88_30970 [candidate division KSB1 bacterium]|nr:hypothetical protein [candidate division KSB1 bacterium]MBL7092357.1 hypothetical protein [candidate division KSB1 bacterium]